MRDTLKEGLTDLGIGVAVLAVAVALSGLFPGRAIATGGMLLGAMMTLKGLLEILAALVVTIPVPNRGPRMIPFPFELQGALERVRTGERRPGDQEILMRFVDSFRSR